MSEEYSGMDLLNGSFQRELLNNQLTTTHSYEHEGKICTDTIEGGVIYHLRNGNCHLFNQDTLNLIADILLGKINFKRGNKEKDSYNFRHYVLFPKYRELEADGITGKERTKILCEVMRKNGFGASKKNLDRLIQEEIDAIKKQQEYLETSEQ